MFPTLCQRHACFNQEFRTNNDLEGNNRRLNALAKDVGLVLWGLIKLIHGEALKVPLTRWASAA